MFEAETLHPADLNEADVVRWRAFQDATPAFGNPLLGPDFARAVGQVRDDARVAVFRRGGEAVGFLPHHRRPGGLGRPIGAPFSDYHALVSAPGAALDGRAALKAAKLRSFRASGLVDPFAAFGPAAGQRDAYVVDLGGDGVEAYWEDLRAASPKRFKNNRRLESKLDREVGELRLVAPDGELSTFETLIDWKRAQFRRTGAQDVLRADWSRELLRRLFLATEPALQGLMLSLYAGDALVGGHMGVRRGGWFHPWIASTDPAFAAWSPGQTFIARAIQAMPGLGLSVYDLGPGYDHYKRHYVREPVQIGEGRWTAQAAPVRIGNRLSRRLDFIAQVELTPQGRIAGAFEAAAGLLRRKSAEAAFA